MLKNLHEDKSLATLFANTNLEVLGQVSTTSWLEAQGVGLGILEFSKQEGIELP